MGLYRSKSLLNGITGIPASPAETEMPLKPGLADNSMLHSKPWQVTFHVCSANCSAMPSMSTHQVGVLSFCSCKISTVSITYMDSFQWWYGNLSHYHGVSKAHFCSTVAAFPWSNLWSHQPSSWTRPTWSSPAGDTSRRQHAAGGGGENERGAACETQGSQVGTAIPTSWPSWLKQNQNASHWDLIIIQGLSSILKPWQFSSNIKLWA